MKHGIKLEAIDGNSFWVNPEFVVLITPMVDKELGVPMLNQCIVHIMGSRFPIKGNPDEVAAKLWQEKIGRVDLA